MNLIHNGNDLNGYTVNLDNVIYIYCNQKQFGGIPLIRFILPGNSVEWKFKTFEEREETLNRVYEVSKAIDLSKMVSL